MGWNSFGDYRPHAHPRRCRRAVRLCLAVEALEDRTLPSVSLVSVNAAGTATANLGTEGNGKAMSASGDGRIVAFVSLSTDMVFDAATGGCGRRWCPSAASSAGCSWR